MSILALLGLIDDLGILMRPLLFVNNSCTKVTGFKLFLGLSARHFVHIPSFEPASFLSWFCATSSSSPHNRL